MKIKSILLSLLLVFSVLIIPVQPSYSTVASSTSRVQYSCNGSTVAFAFTFGVLESSELEVILTNSSNVETILTETTHYSVSCTNNDCTSGGTVTTVATYATGNKITILRNVPLTQESDFTEGMPTLYETFEEGLDKLTRIAQQLEEGEKRDPKLAKSSAYAEVGYTFPDPQAGKIIAWNSAGTNLEAISASNTAYSGISWLSDYSNDLATAVAAIGSTPKTLIVNIANTLSASVSTPSTLSVIYLKGAVTTKASTYTLSFGGPFEAGLYQCFSGFSAGDVTFGLIKKPLVEWWGIDGTDDDVEIQCAVSSITTGNAILNGTYYATGTVTIANDRVGIEGKGKQTSIINFNPSVAKPFISITKGASTCYQNTLKGFSINGSGTVQKIGIRATDVSELNIEDVSMLTMSGNSSIGIQLRGKDSINVNRISINADIPISIEDNPNSTIDIDHAHFQDCYLLAATDQPCVKIADGINLTNVLFDGYQAWCIGKYGLYWNSTTATRSSLNLVIKNLRYEQETDATGYMIYISTNYAVYNVSLENIYGGATAKGFYFRKVINWTIKDSTYISTTNEALNIDNTTYIGRGINNYWQTGATATISSLTLIEAKGIFQNATLASDFTYRSTDNPANQIGIALVPDTDDSYYLGEVTTPFKAWKGIIIKDKTNGKHYKIEISAGAVTVTALD